MSESDSTFSIRWVGLAILVGLGLEIASWVVFSELFSGLSAYLVLGLVVGIMSEGRTVIEPAVAAFVVMAVGYVLGNIILSLLGVGLILAVAYGIGGFLLALIGAYVGEEIQAALES